MEEMSMLDGWMDGWMDIDTFPKRRDEIDMSKRVNERAEQVIEQIERPMYECSLRQSK